MGGRHAAQHPAVGLAQTQAALDDMERRFRAGGHSMQTIYNLRCKIADHIGDEPEARKWFDLWRTAERDENSDCAGCDPSRQAELLAGWGEWDDAVATVEPVLSGVLGCAEQPEKALVAVLHAVPAAGPATRRRRRRTCGRTAATATSATRSPFLPEHLRFCALTGNVDRAVDILAEHLSWLDRPYDDASAMEFAAAGALRVPAGRRRPAGPSTGRRSRAAPRPTSRWSSSAPTWPRRPARSPASSTPATAPTTSPAACPSGCPPSRCWRAWSCRRTSPPRRT